MGLLTFDPRPLVAGLLGMGAMGSRRGSNRGVASSERPATTFRKPAPFAMEGMRAMGLPPFVRLPEQPRPAPKLDHQIRPTVVRRQHSSAQQPHAPELPPGVDWNVVRGLENLGGTPATEGYVPDPKSGRSGVTISSGLDLGQHDERGLRQMGIGDPLIGRMKPFLGLKGNEADQIAGSLKISEAEAAEIEKHVFEYTYRDVARRFNQAARPGLKFESLPSEAQTVILSVAHQHGKNLAKNAPKFWSHVTQGRWKDADAELRHFGDAYSTRRRHEADLLARAIKEGSLQSLP